MTAIVVPIYRPTFEPFELAALRSIADVLNSRDLYLAMPDSLRISELPQTVKSLPFSIQYFSHSHFRSKRSYSRLLMSPHFYRMFSMHAYLLIAQLDSLILRDRLDNWTNGDYDFVGSPLRANYGKSMSVDAGPGLNGGLSIRNIQAALRILSSRDGRRIRLNDACRMEQAYKTRAVRVIRDGIAYNYSSQMRKPRINEDLYWSYFTPAVNTWFRVPPPESAAMFGFDAGNGWYPTPAVLANVVGIHAFQLLPLNKLRSNLSAVGAPVGHLDALVT